MTSAIEIVSLSATDMISPKKRVRKAIGKVKNDKESLNGPEKIENHFQSR